MATDLFNIEVMYQDYLKKVKLEEIKMLPIQKTQLRQTFFAACGSLLITIRDELPKLSSEKEKIDKFQSLLNQVSNEFLNYRQN